MEGGAHPSPFASLHLIRKMYPFTAGLIERVFQKVAVKREFETGLRHATAGP